ncbi:MAG: cytidine deaminase [Planctomycetes bacterium]|nr:cytidine deaminase [Planctomycetota bacterium]MCB9910929.1 cytidine deaminase [Planctomycetota bacterium]MCB9911604.1 cytidine deaminase [Planctomycetota bacterium]HPF15155.1 cytidine deaminase [Planctomycetota bacterium]
MVEPNSLDPQDRLLVEEARRIRERAYSPYSNFAVGAALRATDGSVHVGCNVENASFGLTLCAERSAVVSAVAQGCQQFEAIAIAAPGDDPWVWPCGACRQVLAEFGPNLTVFLVSESGKVARSTLLELLPHQFHFPGSEAGK